jgi:hypothetical protein
MFNSGLSTQHSALGKTLLHVLLLLAIRASGQPVTVVAYDGSGKVLHEGTGTLVHAPVIKHHPRPPSLMVPWREIRGAARVEIFLKDDPRAAAPGARGMRIPIRFVDVAYDSVDDLAVLFVNPSFSGDVPCSKVDPKTLIGTCVLRGKP